LSKHDGHSAPPPRIPPDALDPVAVQICDIAATVGRITRISHRGRHCDCAPACAPAQNRRDIPTTPLSALELSPAPWRAPSRSPSRARPRSRSVELWLHASPERMADKIARLLGRAAEEQIHRTHPHRDTFGRSRRRRGVPGPAVSPAGLDLDRRLQEPDHGPFDDSRGISRHDPGVPGQTQEPFTGWHHCRGLVCDLGPSWANTWTAS